MLITPFSDSNLFAAKGPLEPTAENFPCLSHFFKCDEGSGNSLTDVVSGSSAATGVTLNWSAVTNGVSIPAGNTLSLTLPNDVDLSGSPTCLLVFVGNKPVTGEFALYDGIVPQFQVFVSGAVTDGTNSASGTVLTASSDLGYGLGFAHNAGGGDTCDTHEGGTASGSNIDDVDNAAAPGDLSLGTIDIMKIAAAAGASASLFGWAFFVFTSLDDLPADTAAAVQWMTAQWLAGNKWIYPGWKGLT